MKMFKKNIILLLIIFFFISNCSKEKDQLLKIEKIPPLNDLYRTAYFSFENGNWDESIKLFQKVETRYSYSEWAPRATLLILFMYFDVGEREKALTYAKKFKKLYPKSKNLDYVDFIIGLVFYEQINVVSKDQTYTKAALNQFNSILKKYPESIYTKDTKLKIGLINEQLAGKELYIARYYMKNSKWIAAIKRLKNIISNYQTTIYTQEALHRLVEIYYNLGNIKEAKKYGSILGYNFNNSDWYKKTYKIVKDKNYNLKNDKVKRKLKDRVINMFKFSK